MGSRGPQPTPTKILKMRGSWRAKINPDEPQPQAKKPTRPKWLNAEAVKVWVNLTRKLFRMGVLTDVDGNALARYCMLFARWRTCEEFLEKHGQTRVVKDDSGKAVDIKTFPQVTIAGSLADQLLRLEQQFGLTPSARARLRTLPETEKKQNGKSQYFDKLA